MTSNPENCLKRAHFADNYIHSTSRARPRSHQECDASVVDRGALKTEGATSSRQKSGSKGRSCLFTLEGKVLDSADQTKSVANTVIRRTETRCETVGGGGTLMDGRREGSANT